MKLIIKEWSENYTAQVVAVPKPQDIGLNTLNAVQILWYQALVGKEVQEWEIMVMIPAEAQISEDIMYHNNLYSMSCLNKDDTKSGYIGNQRRVRAIRLGWHSSNCLLLNLQALDNAWIHSRWLNEWDSFNILDNKEVCIKYLKSVKESGHWNKTKWLTRKFSKIDEKNFPEHFSTLHLWKFLDSIKSYMRMIITQKLHGTSGRFGFVEVKIKKSLIDRIFNRQRYKYDYVAGSRRSIKDGVLDGFYNSDVWNDKLKEIKHLIPKDTILYGEIIGYVKWTSSPIQKWYTYNLPVGTNELYIYRITSNNHDGLAVDWSRNQIKAWCKGNGLKEVPELVHQKNYIFYHFTPEVWLDVRYHETFSNTVVVDEGKVDEGIWVRIEDETFQPILYKLKSPKFLEHETDMLDQEVLDIESEN